RAEVEPLIGFFVNTLAMRVQLDGAPSVAQLLERVKQVALGAYAHQDLPFEQVVEALKPVRSLAHSPVFQVMLTMNVAPPKQELGLSDLDLSIIHQERHTTQFDLSLAITESGQSITCNLDYASDLFDAASIERLAGQLQAVLAAMVADDAQPVAALPLLDEAGRKQVLVDFNANAADLPQDVLVHQLFEARVLAQPDAAALRFGDELLSYDELNRLANRVAHRLLALGVKPDTRVAICMERGIEMVVGLLAILKAGGAYVRPAVPMCRSIQPIRSNAWRICSPTAPRRRC
ncbi:condensation domain-containing protein, partial [Duganella sp. Root1480D1]|uniref:condensation domain-containing protein n=1 Tax=Duganella sp. Root1480D1 TaxID=1736471 RepID=UPI001E411788